MKQTTREEIRAIAEEVRREFDARHEEEKDAIFGACLHLSQRLEKKLNEAGIKARRHRGTYGDCEDEYPTKLRSLGLRACTSTDEEEFDGKWTHWWVVCIEQHLIVDISADQFHPSDPEPYRIVITDFDDEAYAPTQVPVLIPKILI